MRGAGPEWPRAMAIPASWRRGLGCLLFLVKPRQRGETRFRDRQHLEHLPHAAGAAADQPLQRARNVLGDFMTALPNKGRARGFNPNRTRKSTWAVTSAWPGFFSGSVKLWRAMAWKVSPASLRT